MRDPVDWPTEDLLAHRMRVTPDRTALVDADGDRTWTYGELDRDVDDLGGALAAAGVDPGDRVGLLLGTRPAFVRLIHAAMRLRATLVPLNAELTTDELGPQVERAGVDHLVCEADTAPAAVRVAGNAPVLSVDPEAHEAVRSLAPIVAERPGGDAVPERPVAREWTQLIMFTSGTTGDPKGVRLTAGNLVASATASAFRLGIRPGGRGGGAGDGDRWLVPLPMYHMGGLAPVVRSTLYGTAVVLQRSFDATETAAVVERHGATGISMVPTMLTRLLEADWRPPDRLRFVLLGGAPTPPELVERSRDRGVPVFPTYGLTETASQVATATPAQAFDHGDTVGQPLLFADVTVVGPDGRPLAPGKRGELVVDGPTVTPGYLDDDRTAAAFGEHGLHTGDVGYRDDDGLLSVVGRVDDAIVTGGENVRPAKVADAVRAHPAVADAAVVGLPDPEWGERVAALVVPESGADPDVDRLAAHCRDRLAGFKVPKTWGVADELPRTASGTVDRAAVRDRLGE
ncbi:MAG: class I adenylate-forming enzyme family protein [Halobacteriales archaeon]